MFLTQELFKPPREGGRYSKKVLYEKAPPQGPTPYLLIIYHVWQKMYPFRIHSIDLRYPFHIPSLELCIAFTAVMALSLKCRWINHKTSKFSQPQNAWPFCTRFLPTEMTDLPTLSYTSTSEIPTLSYPWPEAWERYPFRAEPLRIDHYRERLPSGSNPNRFSLVMGRGCT